MSELIVQVTTISKIREHPSADALEIAEVLGWQLCIGKDDFQEGDKIVYFPPDTVLSEEVSDRFGVTKYLSKGRIKRVRLRGEPSFGLAVKPDDDSWEMGTNVAEHYGATKYEPPIRARAEDALPDHPLFQQYTNIENMRNFPDIFEEGEPVIVTEKLHGSNCRLGIIDGEIMAGSHRLRRKRPEEIAKGHLYWSPLLDEGVRDLLNFYKLRGVHQAILFGEVYGTGVQSLQYGMKNDTGFAGFDLMVDGKYLNPYTFVQICYKFGIPTVPIIPNTETECWEFPFSIETIRGLSEGSTHLAGDHIREGVVVRPVEGRTHPAIGRVILKYVSDTYLLGKHSDFTEM